MVKLTQFHTSFPWLRFKELRQIRQSTEFKYQPREKYVDINDKSRTGNFVFFVFITSILKNAPLQPLDAKLKIYMSLQLVISYLELIPKNDWAMSLSFGRGIMC